MTASEAIAIAEKAFRESGWQFNAKTATATRQRFWPFQATWLVVSRVSDTVTVTAKIKERDHADYLSRASLQTAMKRKLGITSVALLVCGVVVVLVGWRPAPKFTITLHGLETNRLVGISAQTLVSNAGPYSLVVDLQPEPRTSAMATDLTPPDPARIALSPTNAGIVTVYLERQLPRRLVAEGSRTFSTNMADRLRYYFAVYVYWPMETVTLDIP